MPTRPDWDSYFMSMTYLVSTRGTCDRKQVGAVIVRDKRILTTGYNGSIPGTPHCDDSETYYQCRKCNKKYTTKQIAPGVPHHGWSWTGHMIEEKKGGHILQGNHCVRPIHAEQNALIQAARFGISTDGATIYINTEPCWQCFKLIVSAGINRIVYRDNYKTDPNIAGALKDLPHVEYVQFQ